MKERGMSDRKLSQLSGIHYTHINRLRNERSVATVATAKKLLGALGVSDEVIDKAV
ncbi:helix-turn-helix domain-containing protein [Sulfitobacter sp. 1A10445]|uniref:helix-turn-helix domain-containing protein n=1 Tax=unclassified Sulfitobacter TaxID=196795 RepID=UPI003747798F